MAKEQINIKELEFMTEEQLTELRNRLRTDLSDMRRKRHELIGQILFYSNEIREHEKET